MVAGPADQGHGLPGGHPPGGPAGKALAIILGLIGGYDFLYYRRYPGLLVIAFFCFKAPGGSRAWLSTPS